MKNILFLVITTLFVNTIYGQSNTENYIHTKIYLTEDGSQKSESIQYFDALGRAKQIINQHAAPTSGKDIVTYFQYNEDGQALKSFLPYPVNNTNLQIQQVSESNINAYYGTQNAYIEKITDQSPFSRTTGLASPGDAWAKSTGRTKKFSIGSNGSNDVIKFQVSATYTQGVLQSSITFTQQYYGSGQLIKNTVVDENGLSTVEYKNSQGQIVLNRKIINSQMEQGRPGDPVGQEHYEDTYYMYNIYGQLVYVIPPLAIEEVKKASLISISVLNNLCYQYIYDHRNRVIKKKLPGKDWDYFVYDKQNRLVASKNAALSSNEWLFSKYDKFGRLLYTGKFNNSSQSAIQSAVDAKGLNNETAGKFNAEGTEVYYTKDKAYPTAFPLVLSINYYDKYPENAVLSTQPGMLTSNLITHNNNGVISNRNTQGMLTASLIKNIEGGKWTKSYLSYDNTARLAETYTQNHLGGYTQNLISLDFTGKPITSITKHKRKSTDNEVIVKNRYAYKNQALEKHYHQVDNNPEELLATYTYNDIGQVTNKLIGGTEGQALQSLDYTYNIRGWLTGINIDSNGNMQAGKLFNYKIKYENPVSSSLASARYNGNISEIDWQYKGGELRRYSYIYDNGGRLQEGIFQQPTYAVPVNNIYGEKVIYDTNGNIKNLKRHAKHTKSNTAVLIDDLEYNYKDPGGSMTNKLFTITDITQNPEGYAGANHTIDYDISGNMTSMMDKGITSISYNYLNLPKTLNFGNTNTYEYRADGTKIKKTFSISNTGQSVITEYLDGFQYTSQLSNALKQALESDDLIIQKAVAASQPETFISEERELKGPINPNPADEPLLDLQFFSTAEGYYNYKSKRYIYHYKDHLGNVRISYGKNSAGSITVLDKNDYYPFGMSISGVDNGSIYDPLAVPYNYKYNQKELQETGFYDYGWRQYMPDIGRWNGMDQLAEAYTSISPYAYVANNPVMFTDPDGRWIDDNGNMSDRSGQTFFMMGPSYQPLLSMGSRGVISNPLYANGGGGGTGMTFSGNNAIGIFGFLSNGGSIDNVKFKQGFARWWEDDEGKIGHLMMKPFSENKMLGNAKGGFNNEPSFVGDFGEGFLDTGKSNMNSGSVWTGYYLSLQATKYEKLFKYTAQISSGLLDKANALKGAKGFSRAGKALGLAGAGLTILEDYQQNGKLGVGTAVKVGIGLATTFAAGAFAPIALSYIIADVTTGLVTGTTITDRIAAGVENTIFGQ